MTKGYPDWPLWILVPVVFIIFVFAWGRPFGALHVVGGVLALAGLIFWVFLAGRAPSPHAHFEELREIQTLPKRSAVNVFHTKKGAATVSWAFAVLPPPEDMDRKKEAVRTTLADILSANPDADLTKYAPALGIDIQDIDRSWTKTDSSPGIWDQLRAHAKQGKPLQEFLDKTPHLSEPKLRRKAQNIYHQTLADEADDDEG